ncbi:MAG TPA: RnfABCDGE type electron transport complex subunit C [Desulfonatronum sp.]|nr:RnfABCDGE type electron transport complex subunit C [Desulfonatronum sp.]
MRAGRLRGGLVLSYPTNGLASPFEDVASPSTAVVPLQQDQGGACAPKVKKNDDVLVGQMIGESQNLHGASIHAPISGKVTEIIKTFQSISGQTVPAVVIESDGQAQWIDNPAESDPLVALQLAGIVDYDRQTIPLADKLEQARTRNVNSLIVNALDIEPILSSRGRLLQEQPAKIATGIDAIKKILNVTQVFITVDENAFQSVSSIQSALGGSTHILPLCNKYPQAVDYMLVKYVTHVEIPCADGVCIPDVGAVVVDVESLAAVGRKKPVVERFLTVTNSKGHVKNIRVTIGTPIRTVLDHCGITPDKGGKILAGGPMSGMAVASPDLPVTKDLVGIHVQSQREVVAPADATCIKCGLCVEVCPMRLMPFMISGFSEKGMYAEAQHYDISACIECGCCEYLCPVKIPMVQFIKFGKKQISDQRSGA